MQTIIRSYANRNRAILDEAAPVGRIYFNLIKLDRGDTHAYRLGQIESLIVPLSGTCDVQVDGIPFADVGGRANVFSGEADSVYAGPKSDVTIHARTTCEIAVGGGVWTEPMQPFRVAPKDVEVIDVGSPETHSLRRIHFILGGRATGRVGRLLISELYAHEGCWSGYPPHKHDQDRNGETAHHEVYHWRFNPPSGFGVQLWYTSGGESTAHVVRHGDTFGFSSGYHPTGSSPGQQSYCFTILVGLSQRPLIQHFEEAHQHLMSRIPGLNAMRASFRS